MEGYITIGVEVGSKGDYDLIIEELTEFTGNRISSPCKEIWVDDATKLIEELQCSVCGGKLEKGENGYYCLKCREESENGEQRQQQ